MTDRQFCSPGITRVLGRVPSARLVLRLALAAASAAIISACGTDGKRELPKPTVTDVSYLRGGAIEYPADATKRQIDFIASRGYKLVRIPFMWGDLQPHLNGPLDPRAVAQLRRELAWVHQAGMYAFIADMSSGWYPRPGGAMHLTQNLSGEDFVQSRVAISRAVRDEPAYLGFDLLNEPYRPWLQSDWHALSQRAVTALRRDGDHSIMVVESQDDWAPGQRPWIKDPDGNTLYSMHAYPGSTGNTLAKGQSVNTAIPAGAPAAYLGQLKTFVADLAASGVHTGYVGETSWPGNGVTGETVPNWQQWNKLGEQFYDYADAHNLWITYWTFWRQPAVVTDAYSHGKMTTQAKVLEAHLSKTAAP